MGQEHQHRLRGAAHLNLVAVDEPSLSYRCPVDVSAATRAAIAKQILVLVTKDFRVISRDVSSGQLQIVGRAAPDGERRLVEGDNAPTLSVIDFEACIREYGHRMREL